jgi:hypothetical protein
VNADYRFKRSPFILCSCCSSCTAIGLPAELWAWSSEWLSIAEDLKGPFCWSRLQPLVVLTLEQFTDSHHLFSCKPLHGLVKGAVYWAERGKRESSCEEKWLLDVWGDRERRVKGGREWSRPPPFCGKVLGMCGGVLTLFCICSGHGAELTYWSQVYSAKDQNFNGCLLLCVLLANNCSVHFSEHHTVHQL